MHCFVSPQFKQILSLKQLSPLMSYVYISTRTSQYVCQHGSAEISNPISEQSDRGKRSKIHVSGQVAPPLHVALCQIRQKQMLWTKTNTKMKQLFLD